MKLETQEQQEPSVSEVIRLAQRLFERDRAAEARKSSLVAAAEEVGIPAEYMAQATAQLKASQSASSQQQMAQRSRAGALMALALGLMVAVILGYLLTSTRVQAPAPPTLVPPVSVPQTAGPLGTHMDAAYVHLEKGEWDLAEREARLGLAETPNVADLHWALGKAQFQKGDLQDALASALEAQRLNPQHTSFPLLAGEAYLKLGDREAAKGAWERVIALDGGRNTWDARTALNLMRQAGLL